MMFGHEDKIRLFKKLANEGNLSHAYLFFGDAQIGKFLFAKALANFLENGKFEAAAEPLLDAEVFSSDEKGTIGIDAMRDLKKFLWQTPFRSSRRLAIINEAEKLTPEAQSSLLKIIEEPPREGFVIFVTYESDVLFPPLVSRLTKIYFERMPEVKIEDLLSAHYKISREKAKIVAGESFGRIGRAINLLGGKKSGESGDIQSDLEERILFLRKKGIIKNAKILSRLLERETFLKRYNLNQNIQKKAVEYELGKI